MFRLCVQARGLRRRAMPTPSRPRPIRPSMPGSGTAVPPDEVEVVVPPEVLLVDVVEPPEVVLLEVVLVVVPPVEVDEVVVPPEEVVVVPPVDVEVEVDDVPPDELVQVLLVWPQLQ
ncbi:MAG: hypothetical protein ABL914_00060 [Novosphingobium sp.]